MIRIVHPRSRGQKGTESRIRNTEYYIRYYILLVFSRDQFAALDALLDKRKGDLLPEFNVTNSALERIQSTLGVQAGPNRSIIFRAYPVLTIFIQF
jgi:hypothetical protein